MKYENLICALAVLSLTSCFSTSTKDDECHRRAENRLELYNKPVYPLTGPEKQDALAALFDECMRYNGEYQREIDTKNALPPTMSAPPKPPQITIVNKPAPLPSPAPMPVPTVAFTAPPKQPLPTPLTSTDWQPYASPDKELEAILGKKY